MEAHSNLTIAIATSFQSKIQTKDPMNGIVALGLFPPGDVTADANTHALLLAYIIQLDHTKHKSP